MELNIIRDWLDETLFTENKMVTYKTLSQKFRIHNSEAKLYLKSFYDANRTDHQNLNAIFYLSGYEPCGSTKVLKINLVHDDELESKKDKLEKVNSCHIYSLQSFPIKNIYEVYLFDEAKNQLISEFTSIRHPDLRLRKQENANIDFLENEKRPEPVLTDHEKDENLVLPVSTCKETCSKSDLPVSSESKKQTKPVSTENKKGAKPISAGNKEKGKPVSAGNKEKGKPVSFGNKEKEKQASTVTKKTEKPVSANTKKRANPVLSENEEDMDEDDIEKTNEKMDVDNESDNFIPATPDLFGKEPKTAKKHKRVVDNDSDFDDFVPATPDLFEKEPKIIKKQKLVDKTYMDDEGYLVTVKEHEIQTVKSGADETQSKVDSNKKPKSAPCGSESSKKDGEKSSVGSKKQKGKPKSSSTDKKQSSLTSFFKK